MTSEPATELFEAIFRGETTLAIEIINKQPSLMNAVNEDGQSAFWQAACRGRVEILQHMLMEPHRSAVDIHKTDRWSRDALEISEAYQHKDVIALLSPHYGVDEYNSGAEAEPTIFENITIELKSLVQILRRALSPAQLNPLLLAAGAFGFAVIGAVGYSVFEHTQKSRRLIADAGNKESIVRVVTSAMDKTSQRATALEAISEDLINAGWTEISVSSQISNSFAAESDPIVYECSILLRRGEEETDLKITVTNLSGSEPEIISNISNMRFRKKSTKDAIVNYAISHCFN